jgi:DNA-binding transcriptional LysR family regulator
MAFRDQLPKRPPWRVAGCAPVHAAGFDAMCRMVAAGLGVAVLSDRLVRPLLRSMGRSRIALIDPGLSTSCCSPHATSPRWRGRCAHCRIAQRARLTDVHGRRWAEVCRICSRWLQRCR